MGDRPGPPRRQSLSDELAQRVRQLIRERGYQPGDRLPSIVTMARQLGVAHPTLREGLRRLEMLGVVEIRHGAGVFVGRDANPLLVTNPIYEGTVSRTLLLDLVDARISIEPACAALAAEHATDDQLAALRALLRAAADAAEPDAAGEASRRFHREIARASGNVVLVQLLDALSGAIRQEQRFVTGAGPLRDAFHAEHAAVLHALERRDAGEAAETMRTHLRNVREALLLDGPPDIDQPT